VRSDRASDNYPQIYSFLTKKFPSPLKPPFYLIFGYKLEIIHLVPMGSEASTQIPGCCRSHNDARTLASPTSPSLPQTPIVSTTQ
jgi:hypothetical protein